VRDGNIAENFAVKMFEIYCYYLYERVIRIDIKKKQNINIYIYMYK